MNFNGRYQQHCIPWWVPGDGAEDEGGFGFCSKTLDPRFRKDGGKAWYAVLKTSEDGGEPYWGREYVEVV